MLFYNLSRIWDKFAVLLGKVGNFVWKDDILLESNWTHILTKLTRKANNYLCTNYEWVGIILLSSLTQYLEKAQANGLKA